MTPLRFIAVSLILCIAGSCTRQATAQEASPPSDAPATRPGQTRKLEHIVVDVANRQVRVDCQAIALDAPLEFLCVRAGGPEHEAILRTAAKPSDIHLGLLMLGLKPGRPVHYSETAQRWFPPIGPPVRITVEYEKDGKRVRTTANRLMRNLQTKAPMPDAPWIFTGSQIMDDGTYAADVTGYVVSVVNFDLTLIDVPDLRSNANETLEWEPNPETMPADGAAVTMILEPVGEPIRAPATAPGAQAAADKPEAPIDTVLIVVKADGSPEYNRDPIAPAQLGQRLERDKGERPVSVRIAAAKDAPHATVQEVTAAVTQAGLQPVVVSADAQAQDAASPAPPRVDEARLRALRQRWEQAVRPNTDALRTAAQSHYEVIMSLRQEQQRLIDEADKIQRLIEDLEREYQEITTPRPME